MIYVCYIVLKVHYNVPYGANQIDMTNHFVNNKENQMRSPLLLSGPNIRKASNPK